MSNLVWVASYPKSGNTWTRAFLLHLFSNAQKPLPLDEMAGMATLDAATHWFNEASGEVNEKYGEEDVAALRVAAQHELAKCFPVTGFVKTHSAFTRWYGHPMFDLGLTAGAIYIVRNPLDIVASYAAHSGREIEETVEFLITHNYTSRGSEKQVPQLMGSWSQNVQSWTAQPNPALHVMRYEDMVQDPAGTFGGLASFLKLDPPVDRLERALKFSSFDQLKQAEAKDGFDEKTDHQSTFFRAGRIGGWQDELTSDQVQRIVDVHRDQMMRFGYVPEGL